jgi:DNA-binding Lrp family transcriptional regulator
MELARRSRGTQQYWLVLRSGPMASAATPAHAQPRGPRLPGCRRSRQRLVDEVAAALAGIPEVLQVRGISGQSDLMVRVVRADADDLYRILAVEGVERTATALLMRELVDYRIMPLLERRAEH